MKKHFFLLLSGFLIITTLPNHSVFAESTEAQAPASEKLSKADQLFISKTLEGGMAEVKLGKLASEKGSREDIKEFGKRMVADHGKASAELEDLAKRKGIAVPEQLSSNNLKKFERLSKLSGKQFDNQYIEEMLEHHRHDVAEFEEATTKLDNPDLKAFAKKTLPVLKSHLQNITEIKNSNE